MKKVLQYLLFATISAFVLASCAPSAVVVRERPVAPGYTDVRPAPPYPGAVWINEDWEYRGGRYEYVRPHWERPPQAGHVWHGGYWENHSHGYSWHKGHWGRK